MYGWYEVLCTAPCAPQVAVQPGLEEVVTDLLQYEEDETGAQFYMKAFPALDGESRLVRRFLETLNPEPEPLQFKDLWKLVLRLPLRLE